MANTIQLRAAVANEPLNAELRYQLATQLTSIQDYECALLEFSTALALDPLLHEARFQWGMLHLGLTQHELAMQVWLPLERLPDGSPLKLFKRGLEAYIRKDFARCISTLEAGMRVNNDYRYLNGDINSIVELLRMPTKPQSKKGLLFSLWTTLKVRCI